MPGIKLFPGEPMDKAERRFRKQTEKAGVLRDAKKHEFYLKPSVKKKCKSIAARKRKLKQLQRKLQKD